MFRWAGSLLGAVLFLSLSPTSLRADEAFQNQFSELLYEGKIRQARNFASSKAGAAEVPEAQFAVGVADFLLATEGLGQDLYRYGWAPVGMNPGTLLGLPLVGLPVPKNPFPQQLTYDSSRTVLSDFVGRLRVAERSLAQVRTGPVGLRIDVASIRLDLNGDGHGERDETVLALVQAAIGAHLAEGQSTFRFDESDVPWLRGYCDLLSALPDFVLAYDYRETFDATAYAVFPQADVPTRPFVDVLSDQQKIVDKGRGLQSFFDRYNYYPDPDDPLFEEWAASDEGRRSAQVEHAATALDAQPFMDGIALVHLIRWNVVDSERLRASRDDLLGMIAMSRASWKLILAEKDNDAEWVPSPTQAGRFSGLRVDQATVDGWKHFLDQFQAVLEGRLLLPHWRFDVTQGVNVAEFFTQARPFDLVMMIQGLDALPYLQTGEVAKEATADQAMSLFQRGSLAYFIWFN